MERVSSVFVGHSFISLFEVCVFVNFRFFADWGCFKFEGFGVYRL